VRGGESCTALKLLDELRQGARGERELAFRLGPGLPLCRLDVALRLRAQTVEHDKVLHGSPPSGKTRAESLPNSCVQRITEF
jgi:hypothetical protein